MKTFSLESGLNCLDDRRHFVPSFMPQCPIIRAAICMYTIYVHWHAFVAIEGVNKVGKWLTDEDRRWNGGGGGSICSAGTGAQDAVSYGEGEDACTEPDGVGVGRGRGLKWKTYVSRPILLNLP